MEKELLLKVIEDKYNELGLDKIDETQLFWKIVKFEGNAIGQIGEEYLKELFKANRIPMDEDRRVIHDEYDILSSGKKIEVKTARKGLKNTTFQFNGINPQYNYDIIVLVGLTYDNVYYNIINGKSVYDHKKRRHYLEVNGKMRQLVQMNPGNSVNYKLTLNIKDLKEINGLVQEIKICLKLSL
jgi:hypothetical protein